MRKVIIIGGDNGGGSAGDEIMCEAACVFFRELDSEVEIVTDAQSENWISPVENIKVIQQLRKDWATNKSSRFFIPFKKIIRLIALPIIINRKGFDWLIGHGKQFKSHVHDADVLFFAGCGGLTDKYPVNVIAWLSMIKSAKNLGIKVYVSGVGIGPVNNWFINRLIKNIINAVDFITVRDSSVSYKYLKENKLDGNFTWVPDDAFFYFNSPRQARDKSVVNIGLNFMPALFRQEGQLLEIAELLKKNLHPKHRLYLLPVTHEDYQILAVLKKHIPAAKLINRSSPCEMKALISSMDFMISTRYHGCVFGVSQKVPTIGLYAEDYWKQKISGLFEMSGIINGALQISDFFSLLQEKGLDKLIEDFQGNVIRDEQLGELNKKAFLAHNFAKKYIEEGVGYQ